MNNNNNSSIKIIEEYAFKRDWVAFENILYDRLYYFYDPKSKIVYGYDETRHTKWFIVKEPVKLARLKDYNL